MTRLTTPRTGQESTKVCKKILCSFEDLGNPVVEQSEDLLM